MEQSRATLPDSVPSSESNADNDTQFDKKEYEELREYYLGKRMWSKELSDGVRLRPRPKKSRVDCETGPGWEALRKRVMELEVDDKHIEIFRLLRQVREFEQLRGLFPITPSGDLVQEVVDLTGMPDDDEIIDVDSYILEVLLVKVVKADPDPAPEIDASNTARIKVKVKTEPKIATEGSRDNSSLARVKAKSLKQPGMMKQSKVFIPSKSNTKNAVLFDKDDYLVLQNYYLGNRMWFNYNGTYLPKDCDFRPGWAALRRRVMELYAKDNHIEIFFLLCQLRTFEKLQGTFPRNPSRPYYGFYNKTLPWTPNDDKIIDSYISEVLLKKVVKSNPDSVPDRDTINLATVKDKTGLSISTEGSGEDSRPRDSLMHTSDDDQDVYLEQNEAYPSSIYPSSSPNLNEKRIDFYRLMQWNLELEIPDNVLEHYHPDTKLVRSLIDSFHDYFLMTIIHFYDHHTENRLDSSHMFYSFHLKRAAEFAFRQRPFLCIWDLKSCEDDDDEDEECSEGADDDNDSDCDSDSDSDCAMSIPMCTKCLKVPEEVMCDDKCFEDKDIVSSYVCWVCLKGGLKCEVCGQNIDADILSYEIQDFCQQCKKGHDVVCQGCCYRGHQEWQRWDWGESHDEEEEEPEVEPKFEVIGLNLPFPVRAFNANEGISPKLALDLFRYWQRDFKDQSPVGDPIPFSILLKFVLDAFIQTKLICPNIRLYCNINHDIDEQIDET